MKTLTNIYYFTLISIQKHSIGYLMCSEVSSMFSGNSALIAEFLFFIILMFRDLEITEMLFNSL